MLSDSLTETMKEAKRVLNEIWPFSKKKDDVEDPYLTLVNDDNFMALFRKNMDTRDEDLRDILVSIMRDLGVTEDEDLDELWDSLTYHVQSR